MSRIARNISDCQVKKYDLIIIGGGIYGIMLTLEASRRNLKSLLLEKSDFAGKTSLNHLRTVHGGFRYLQSLDLVRFRESIKERKWFLKYFPQYINVLPCIMPLYGQGLKRNTIMGPALIINDLLSFDRNRSVDFKQKLPGGSLFPAKRTREVFPFVKRENLKGGAVWYDASMPESQRLYMKLLRTAAKAGAEMLNYVEVKGLRSANNQVEGVQALDLQTGMEFEFNAPVIINATGPFSRETAVKLDRDFPVLFPKKLLLWNLLFDRPALSDHALALSQNKNSHTYFFHPWKNRLLIGTGEIPATEANGNNPVVPRSEILKFISDINQIIPELNLKPDEVLRVYSGIIPADETGKLSKRPALVDHGRTGGPVGLFSLAGIKFTTSRLVSENLIKSIFPGKKPQSYDRYFPALADPDFFVDYSWEPGQQDLASLGKIIDNESVLHLSDLILRRTSIGDNPERALRILPGLRPLFNWDNTRWQQEIVSLKKELYLTETKNEIKRG